MIVKNFKNPMQISSFLEEISTSQAGYELGLNKVNRKQNGVFFTNSLDIVENVISIIEINSDILKKRILEPSCGQGIFILKIISKVYQLFPDKSTIAKFISDNIYFVDVQEEMIEQTKSNINALYKFLFGEDYKDNFNAITWDFTDKASMYLSLFSKSKVSPFTTLYNTFDFVIGNPPYVTLYGRRDKKQNEEQRINYLKNYNQFPESLKNGKINYVMLFVEHSLDFLKKDGKLSFIIDVSFFETAYEFTRKYLLENTKIEELHVNIKNFDVASGQVILKVAKSNSIQQNRVRIQDHKKKSSYFIEQSIWKNKDDEYKFRFNECSISKLIIEKIISKKDKTLLELFPDKNLRTCTMLLDMEDQFTFIDNKKKNSKMVYPYYQGSKALSEKYGKLIYTKYFTYDKSLQDQINDKLKIKLESEGIKNKKRIGLGETIIYDCPKLYVRQSAKEIIATVDLEKSAANNSLYVFSLRNNSVEAINFLYFLCGWMNSDLITYYAQEMNIIRYSPGKQPQIKISDLGTIYIPNSKELQNKISTLCKSIFIEENSKEIIINEMNNIIYDYYGIVQSEIRNLRDSIKAF